MSTPQLKTALLPDSQDAKTFAEFNHALVERLKADVAKAALGGSEK